MDTPILVQDDTTAEAAFDVVAEKILKDDWDEVKDIVDYGEKMQETNRLIEFTGVDIHWFVDVKINEYLNT